MKLKSITVTGLFNCYNHHIELNEEGLTFIHAKNGAGKSTTLKMVYDFFTGDFISLVSIPFKTLKVVFNDGTEIIVNNKETLEIIGIKDSKQYTPPFEDLMVLYHMIYISPERNVITDDPNNIQLAIDVYSSKFRDMIYRARTHCILIPAKSKMGNLTESDFLFLCKNLKARMDFISDIGLSVKIPDGFTFPPSRYEYSKKKEEYEDLVQSISDWVDEFYPMAESMIAFIDIINDMYNNKKIYVDEGLRLSIKLANGETIPVKKLSAGEKQILIIFYRLLFHTAKDTLAIVDEPEISLHISWQQKLAELFLEVSRLKDIQILVATHSPQVIHDRWDLAYELRMERA